MKLTVLDRILLLGMLPKEGDITTLKIIRKLREDLSFSETEHKELKFTSENNSLHWEKNIEKEIEIGEKATEIITIALKSLNEQKRLHEDCINTYEKFIKC